LVIHNNEVKEIFSEIDDVGLTCSLSQNVLDVIKKDGLPK
jgi:hypothetical protein